MWHKFNPMKVANQRDASTRMRTTRERKAVRIPAGGTALSPIRRPELPAIIPTIIGHGSGGRRKREPRAEQSACELQVLRRDEPDASDAPDDSGKPGARDECRCPRTGEADRWPTRFGAINNRASVSNDHEGQGTSFVAAPSWAAAALEEPLHEVSRS